MGTIRMKQIGAYRYGYRVETYRDEDGRRRERWVYLGKYDPTTDSFIKVRETDKKYEGRFRIQDPLKPGRYYKGAHVFSRMYERECAQCGGYDPKTGKCKETGEYIENLSGYCEAFYLPEDGKK